MAFAAATTLPKAPPARRASSPARRPPRALAGGRRRLPANAAGNVYVDSACIDCDTCRWLAPGVFSRARGQSAVYAQPGDAAARAAAARAAVACPTGSIRAGEALKEARDARDAFPMPVADGVWYMGYASRQSFACCAWLVEAGGVRVLFDVPRFSSRLAGRVREMGGVDFIVLSHRDDVYGHARWGDEFPGAKRVIHAEDVRASQGTDACELVLRGEGRWQVAEGVEVVHVPGHSIGSVAMLVRERGALFTGDHLAYSARTGGLTTFPRYGYDLELQRESVRKLTEEPFLHVYPGHGRRHTFRDAQDRRESLLRLADVPVPV